MSEDTKPLPAERTGEEGELVTRLRDEAQMRWEDSPACEAYECLTAAANRIEQLERERDAALRDLEVRKAVINAWLIENSPGGWIDDLRKHAERAESAERELAAAKRGLEERGDALRWLVNDLVGILSLSREAIRDAAGNTNLACLDQRIEAATAALSAEPGERQ